jgi:hypothetical protein
MQGSHEREKMNPQAAAYGDKRGEWCDDGVMKAWSRKSDNSKPRRKDYSQARAIKLRSREYAECL